MEYFGRLGLVFRKNKERGSSPCPSAVSKEVTRCAVEPWGDRSSNQRALDTDPKSVISESRPLTPSSETGRTKGKGDMKSMPVSTRAECCSRQDVCVDVEYLEYEQYVAARARALKDASSRAGWRALIFWKRHPRPGGVKPFTSAASTPLHQCHPFPTPLHRKAATPGRKRGCATVGPLYTNESPPRCSTALTEPGRTTATCHRMWPCLIEACEPYRPGHCTSSDAILPTPQGAQTGLQRCILVHFTRGAPQYHAGIVQISMG